MRKSKERFEERPISHAEKKQLAYWINQGIDIDQLKHLKGDKQRWK